LGIGDWGLGPIPNPQSPIPNPQSPIPIKTYLIFNHLTIKYFKFSKIIYLLKISKKIIKNKIISY
jgi:hypothetical protein